MELLVFKFSSNDTPAYGNFWRAVILSKNLYDTEEINNREYLERVNKAINAYALAVASDPATCQKQAEKVACVLGRPTAAPGPGTLELEFRFSSNGTPAYGDFWQSVMLSKNLYDGEDINNRIYLGRVTKAINAYAMAVASDPATCRTQSEKAACVFGRAGVAFSASPNPKPAPAPTVSTADSTASAKTAGGANIKLALQDRVQANIVIDRGRNKCSLVTYQVQDRK